MRSAIKILVFVAMVPLLFGGCHYFYKHKDKPPGWEQGEKKGWDGNKPPGQQKKGY